MSDDVIISLENVGKKYCRSPKRTLVYGIRDVARDVFGLRPVSTELRRDEFWALNNVSFEVKRGECLGVIGANGAGKSTLLKLLNGVILPDRGAILVNGRVGGLLELGAGFHPMLTGRENIHLSGAILGLSKDEINDKFPSIVEFAGLEDFIDSPVKYYSSGMYVRLGFAVAINVDPDILIIDESMAVGDTAFRRRCLNKINAFLKSDKTIIVVTHNLQEIETIASRIILLNQGLIRSDGVSKEVINSYLELLSEQQFRQQRRLEAGTTIRERSTIEMVDIEVLGKDGRKRCYFRTHDELQVRIRFKAYQPVMDPVFRVQIYRDDGLFCHGTNTERHKISLGRVHGESWIVLRYADLTLLQGNYSIHVSVLATQYDDFPMHEIAASHGIHMESSMKDGGGVFAMPAEWIVAPINVDDSRSSKSPPSDTTAISCEHLERDGNA
jgi:lipopolysaccharide transport system ATP-binding protein